MVACRVPSEQAVERYSFDALPRYLKIPSLALTMCPSAHSRHCELPHDGLSLCLLGNSDGGCHGETWHICRRLYSHRIVFLCSRRDASLSYEAARRSSRCFLPQRHGLDNFRQVLPDSICVFLAASPRLLCNITERIALALQVHDLLREDAANNRC